MTERKANITTIIITSIVSIIITILGFFITHSLSNIERGIDNNAKDIKDLSTKLWGETNERTTKDKEHDIEIQNLKTHHLKK